VWTYPAEGIVKEAIVRPDSEEENVAPAMATPEPVSPWVEHQTLGMNHKSWWVNSVTGAKTWTQPAGWKPKQPKEWMDIMSDHDQQHKHKEKKKKPFERPPLVADHEVVKEAAEEEWELNRGLGKTKLQWWVNKKTGEKTWTQPPGWHAQLEPKVPEMEKEATVAPTQADRPVEVPEAAVVDAEQAPKEEASAAPKEAATETATKEEASTQQESPVEKAANDLKELERMLEMH